MTSEVCFFDVAKKEIVARTQLTPHISSIFFRFQCTYEVITCGSQYHVVYTRSVIEDTLLLQKTDIVNLSEVVLKNLKSTEKYIVQACFSPGGGLLLSIHILDISTFQIVCVLHNIEVDKVEFFHEEHLLCKRNFTGFLFLANAKHGDILAGISVGLNGKWDFSVCRKTGDIVVFDTECRTLRLFKLWLPHQR